MLLFFFLFLEAIAGHFLKDSLNVLFRNEAFTEHNIWIFNNPRIEVVELCLILPAQIYLPYLQIMRMNLILILATHEAYLDLGVFASGICGTRCHLLHVKIEIKRYYFEPELFGFVGVFCSFVSEGHEVSGILAELLSNIHQTPFLQSILIQLGIVFVEAGADEAVFEDVCMNDKSA